MDRQDHGWSGYAAFLIDMRTDEPGIHLRSVDTRPFTVKDELGLPDVLQMTRWGDWEYSTWCANANDAIQEAMCSKSRGRKILGDYESDISMHPWLVFNLNMSAPQVCALLNDFTIVVGTERKNRKTWRIHQDIVIAEILRGGGYLKKMIIAPQDQSWDVDGIYSYSELRKGMCGTCRRSGPHMLTFEKKCAWCYGVPSPAEQVANKDSKQILPALMDKPESYMEHLALPGAEDSPSTAEDNAGRKDKCARNKMIAVDI